MSTARPVGCMTREQRDLLRKQIDVRMRERLARLSKQGGSPPGSKPPQVTALARAAAAE